MATERDQKDDRPTLGWTILNQYGGQVGSIRVCKIPQEELIVYDRVWPDDAPHRIVEVAER